MALAGFLARRVAISIVLLVVLSVATFAIFFAIPANPGRILFGGGAFVPDAQLARANEALGTDRPKHEQYLRSMGDLLRGDFGTSWSGATMPQQGPPKLEGQSVNEVLFRSARVTASLALGGAVLLVLLAVPLGVLAASRAGSWLDRTLIVVTLVAISTHPLVVGLVLRLLAADRWGLTPPNGYCPLLGEPAVGYSTSALSPSLLGQACSGPRAWAHHLVLPWLTFALLLIALYMRMIRFRVLEVLGEPHVRTARAKGASEWRVLTRHTVRTALAPVVPMLAMDLGLALGIAIYVESVFRLPGLGQLAVTALSGQSGYDRPVIVGLVLLTGTAIVVLNLLADLVLALVDPRVRERGADRSTLGGPLRVGA